MSKLYQDMLIKNLISIKRIPRNEKLVQLLRYTKNQKRLHIFQDVSNLDLVKFVNHFSEYNDVVIMSLN
jgi:hypothetical protein